MLKNIPIRRKVMLILLVTNLVVIGLMLGTFFTYEFLSFRRATIRQISTLGEIIAANSTAALAFQNQEDANEILGALRVERHIVAAALYDQSGRVFSSYPENLPAGVVPLEPGLAGYRFVEDQLTGFQPVAQKDRRLGMLFLKFDTGILMREWLWSLVKIGLAVMAGVLIVAYGISRLLQKQISQPILALAETARAISERSDYSVRAVKLGDDELGRLTDAFNQMLSEIHALHQDLERRVEQRTAQLEAANRELEAFSYSVSHDLRAPLRAVDGFSQVLQEDCSALLPEENRRHLGLIRQGAQHMGELIDDLLKFAQYSRQELNKRKIDTGQLVRSTLDELGAPWPDRKVEVRVGNLPASMGDPALLKQVWVNLLSNALKYTRKRDKAVIEIGYTPDREGSPCFVRDNGTGFDMQYANKLFGVFQRLHRAEEYEGTGVGLAIVQRIINRHGGRIWAEAAMDRGATFYFTLEGEPKE